MKTLVLDLETTVEFLEGGLKDNSPFNPKNRIVSAHFAWVYDNQEIGPCNTLVFHHKEQLHPDSPDDLHHALKEADRIVAHNAKYDVMYLLESGFTIPDDVYCTMVGEYILARGQRLELSLEATAIRRNTTLKKSDLISSYFKKGIGFEAMPLASVVEYAEADVQSCAEVYLQQLEDYEQEAHEGLKPVLTLMSEMLLFLTEIERNGVRIDLDVLSEVEKDYLAEKAQIEKRLSEIVKDVMGDTPINLASGADMTKVIYSREVVDKNLHKETFNIGLDHRGKPLMRPRMTASAFTRAVRMTTKRVMRTVAYHCNECGGTGKITKIKKDGKPFKNPSKCPSCGGQGFTLMENGKVAGLKLVPEGPQDAGINGFNADKVTIKRLIVQAEIKNNLEAVEFLTGVSRLNAINTYLDSFVRGIQRWTRSDGVLHAQFNQTTTRTGRLSSSNPNFQNQPKGGKFPVRKAVISRFDGGQVIEADFSGLEFRVAGELSRDPQIIEDIMSGKDVHKQTAMIINECPIEDVTKDMRQGAKAYCVTMDTEALTRTGWKMYDDLKVGEDILTYNSETGKTEWKPLLELAFFENEQVLTYGNAHWEVSTTPNHRWYGFRRAEGPGGVRKLVPAVFTADQITSEHSIIASARCDDEGMLSITPEQASMIGWVVSDGTYGFSNLPDGPSRSGGKRHGCYASVIQKKGMQSIHIEHILEGKYTSVASRDEGTQVWNIAANEFRTAWNAGNLDMFNPNWVEFISKCSPEARYAFLNAVLLAEGTQRKHGQWRISQNRGHLADAIRVGLHLEGHDTRMSTSLSYTGRLHDVYTARKKSHITCQRFKNKKITNGDVWCPRTDNGTWVMRQGKVVTITGNTFAPLYGGMGAGEPPHVQTYFREYFNIYQGLGRWHQKLMDGVLKDGLVRIPSGREFFFPGARRLRNGRITNATAVVNYPVQSFATGDIVPLACVRTLRKFRLVGLKSKLVLTVHDSIVVDCHPDEVNEVKQVLIEAMTGVKDDLKQRFNYDMTLPLDIEISAGPNWMDMQELHLD